MKTVKLLAREDAKGKERAGKWKEPFFFWAYKRVQKGNDKASQLNSLKMINPPDPLRDYMSEGNLASGNHSESENANWDNPSGVNEKTE